MSSSSSSSSQQPPATSLAWTKAKGRKIATVGVVSKDIVVQNHKFDTLMTRAHINRLRGSVTEATRVMEYNRTIFPLKLPEPSGEYSYAFANDKGNSRDSAAPHWRYFTKVTRRSSDKTKKDTFVLICRLCNDGSIIGGGNNGAYKHLVKHSQLEMIPTEMSQYFSGKANDPERLSDNAVKVHLENLDKGAYFKTLLHQLAAHDVAEAMVPRSTSAKSTISNAFPSKQTTQWRNDVANAILVSVDMRSLNTINTSAWKARQEFLDKKIKSSLYRVNIALASLGSKVLDDIQVAIDKSRRFFQLAGWNVPFVFYLGDGWARNDGNEWIMSKVIVLVPVFDRITGFAERIERREFSLGARLAQHSGGSIRAEDIAATIRDRLGDVQINVPSLAFSGDEFGGVGMFKSDIFGSAVDNGSNFQKAMNECIPQVFTQRCVSHTLDNAITWACGIKPGKKSKNPLTKGQLKVQSTVVSKLRNRKVANLVSAAAKKNRFVYSRVPEGCPTRWSGVYLTSIKFLMQKQSIISGYFDAVKHPPETGCVFGNETEKHRKVIEKFEEKGQGWQFLQESIDILHTMHGPTIRLQNPDVNVVDAALEILQARVQVLSWTGLLQDQCKTARGLFERYFGRKIQERVRVVWEVVNAAINLKILKVQRDIEQVKTKYVEARQKLVNPGARKKFSKT